MFIETSYITVYIETSYITMYIETPYKTVYIETPYITMYIGKLYLTMYFETPYTSRHYKHCKILDSPHQNRKDIQELYEEKNRCIYLHDKDMLYKTN